jgi:CRISPR/Cas system CSM-associated protein Csm4 (group 5 of RAMP superfamily)
VHGHDCFLLYREKRDRAFKPHAPLGPAHAPCFTLILAPTPIHALTRLMTDTTESASAPKKRSFFKRAAWQDAPKKEGQDIFSHSNEFKDIVAEQNKRIEEEKRKEEEAKQRRKAEHAGNKRRRISTENDEPNNTTNEASSGARATRTSSKAYVYV